MHDFFSIKNVFDIISIIGFLISFWLAYRKIFVEGRPKLELNIKFSHFLGTSDNQRYIGFSIINNGYGEVHLTSCGFLLFNNKQLVLMPGSYVFVPFGEGIPYTLDERRSISINYPVTSFMKLEDRCRIKKFFVRDETGKTWDFNIQRFLHKNKLNQ